MKGNSSWGVFEIAAAVFFVGLLAILAAVPLGIAVRLFRAVAGI